MKKNEIELMVLRECSEKHNEVFENFLSIQQKIFKNPNLKKIDNHIRTLKTDIANLKFENKDTKKLENELAKAEKQLITLLEENNIEKSLLVPSYSCSFCEDIGIVNKKHCPHCFSKNYLKKLIELSNVDLKQVNSLEKIDTKIYGEKEKEIIDIISKLKNLSSSSKNTVIFAGKTGTGKTYLSKSFLKYCLKQFKYSRYVSAYNLAKEITPTAENNFNTKLQDYIDYDVLVIDDLGSEPKYKNFGERLLNIINERQESDKITIITTNFMPKELAEAYSERIFSRFFDKNISFVYLFSGNDLRLKI